MNPNSSISLISPASAPCFQDVRDHVLRAAEHVETARM
jgi:hypothetical protein